MATVDGVLIRDAAPEDAEGIARTHIACWQEAYAGQLPADFLAGLDETFERRAEFWGHIASAGGPQEVLLVAEANGEVVGFVHVCPTRDPFPEEGTAEVTAIYLRRSHWDRGIGRELLAQAVDRVRAFGFGAATLWVLDTNERTRRFYEAAGWKEDGSEKEDHIGDLTVREIRYRCDL